MDFHSFYGSSIANIFGRYLQCAITENITKFLCYKTNFQFLKTKLLIVILTFHILELSGYHNINIYILILIFHNIKLLLLLLIAIIKLLIDAHKGGRNC